jgi:Family of unknown function (DUF6350)
MGGMAEQDDPRFGAATLPDAIRAALGTVRQQAIEHSPDVALGLLAALCVAAAGWLVAVVITFAIWVPSAPSGNGVDTPFHVAGQLWLAAHHVLLRTPDGLFGLTPLGFTLLPCVGLVLAGRYAGHRYGATARVGRISVISAIDGNDVDDDDDWDRDSVDGDAVADPGRPFETRALWLLGGATAGYALCAQLIAWTAADGPLHADLRACVSYPSLLAAAGFGAGFLTIHRPRLDRWAAAALRAAAVAAAMLLCGAMALSALALALSFPAVGAVGHDLGGGIGAETGLFLIDLALLPNLAGWALSYSLGPGFAVGAGSTVSMFGSTHGALPELPVLAAIPDPGPGSPWLLAAGLVPLVAAALAVALIHRLVTTWPDRFAALAAASAAVGLACGLFAALSGGPVAAGVMAVTGPAGWQVGLAAGGLIALVGSAGFGLSAALGMTGLGMTGLAVTGLGGVEAACLRVLRRGADKSRVVRARVGRAPGQRLGQTAVLPHFEAGAASSIPFGSALQDDGAADHVGEGPVLLVPERGEVADVAGQAVEDVGQPADEGHAETGGLQVGFPQDPDADDLLADGLPGGPLPVELPQLEDEGEQDAQQEPGHAGSGGLGGLDQVAVAVVGVGEGGQEDGEADHEQRDRDQAVEQSGGYSGAPGGEIGV